MAFQQTAYNNYDPRPMPVGTDLMARGGGYYSDSGIADDFIPFISQENDLPFLGQCNFPNKADEVYPCMPSQALHLDRTFGAPPIIDGFAYRPIVGNARNQARGLGTDRNRDALFRQRLLPPPMNNNMRNYGP
tara:strand:+ start:70 stop:468 length:399 start_codon:yes stop_codon:yes gene_type:complete